MYLTDEQRKIGRRNFLKAIAAVPAAAALPFVYTRSQMQGGPLKVGVIGIGNEGRALMHNTDPEFVQVVAVADIYPPHRELAHRYAKAKFDPAARAYDDYTKLLEDREVEAVIIAVPLHVHYPVVMDALEAGKHVLCEKLMAYSIEECQAMIAKADAKDLVLSIGHQRHYSNLYHQALEYVRNGDLGDIYYIRAQWHRKTNWSAPLHRTPEDVMAIFSVEKDGKPWKGASAELTGGNTWYKLKDHDLQRCRAALQITRDEAKALLEAAEKVDYMATGNTNPDKYGYRDYTQFRNWRLYKRYSQGLMGELGSHQMDACGILLGHAHPTAVFGTGHQVGPVVAGRDGRLPSDQREIKDHIYAQFEYPGKVTVTYSSIVSNAFDNYGETVFGTKGTLIIEAEKSALLFPDGPDAKNTEMTVSGGKGSATWTDTSATAWDAGKTAAGPAGGAGDAAPSRGYKEEIQHFAICVRSRGTDQVQKPRCDGRQALGDAVIAIKANEAIESNQRVAFQDSWFKV